FVARQQARDGRLRVVMEATGIYYLDLAVQLVEAGVEVMVLNPKAAHHFARAMGQRSKTDALDARMLLAYLQRMDFVPWAPPARPVLELRQLGRHLCRLAEQRVRLKNQLHALRSTQTSPRVVIEDVQEELAALERRIERLTAEALARVRSDAAIAERFEALDSITGVGPTSALALLAEQRVRLKNQLHALRSTQTSPRVVIEDVQEELAALERRIERLTAEALARVRSDAAIAERFEALDSITGVGPTSALALLAEL